MPFCSASAWARAIDTLNSGATRPSGSTRWAAVSGMPRFFIMLDGGRHGGLGLLVIGYVATHRDGPATSRVDVLGDLFGGEQVKIDHRYGGTVLGESLSHGQPQARATTGDQGRLAG